MSNLSIIFTVLTIALCFKLNHAQCGNEYLRCWTSDSAVNDDGYTDPECGDKGDVCNHEINGNLRDACYFRKKSKNGVTTYQRSCIWSGDKKCGGTSSDVYCCNTNYCNVNPVASAQLKAPQIDEYYPNYNEWYYFDKSTKDSIFDVILFISIIINVACFTFVCCPRKIKPNASQKYQYEPTDNVSDIDAA
eukprot:891789_1